MTTYVLYAIFRLIGDLSMSFFSNKANEPNTINNYPELIKKINAGKTANGTANNSTTNNNTPLKYRVR